VIAVPIGDCVARWACLFTAAVNTATATHVLRVAGIAWVFAATCDEYNEPNRENSVQKPKEETFHKFSKRFNAQCAQKVKGTQRYSRIGKRAAPSRFARTGAGRR
jgi:hypothetical protein